MSVLKNLQNLSDLEFYKCAEKDQEEINAIFAKYGNTKAGAEI